MINNPNYSSIDSGKYLNLSLILAVCWGGLLASFLQFSQAGRWLAARRTWITVVVGVGVDVLLMWPLLPVRYLLRVIAILAASSIFIIGRSLINELTDQNERNRFLNRH